MSLTVLVVCLTLVSHIANAGSKLPQVSEDGLRLSKQDDYAAVYLKDGAVFGGYDKVAILDCTVEFRKNWQRDQNEDIPFSVKDKHAAPIQLTPLDTVTLPAMDRLPGSAHCDRLPCQ
jgi:hypothetical protein